MTSTPQFTKLPYDRRATAFEQAATERGIHPMIMEKDYWVSWLLGLIFKNPKIAAHLVFKGGTSLSKVYKTIDRFSEDIDLSVSPIYLGFDVAELERLSSRSQRDDAMNRMQAACLDKAKKEILVTLEEQITEELGAPEKGPWLTFDQDQHTHSPVIYFEYPGAIKTELAYINRSVKLELGSLTDQQPTGTHLIRPWVAEKYPEFFNEWKCEVVALDVSRTFWEKATILHSEYHRESGQPTPDRYARHYYDITRLLSHPESNRYTTDRELAIRVAHWKSQFFARRWAHYETARHGTLKLLPQAARIKDLERDYAAMQPFFLSQPPSFQDIVGALKAGEEKINANAASTE